MKISTYLFTAKFAQSLWVFIACVFIAACNADNKPQSSPNNHQEAAAVSNANNKADLPASTPYSPYANREYPTQVFFGDTHLHTSNSGDAFAFGARLSPADAYRFARGERVNSTTGQAARLVRPLDFLVIADHAEGLGVMQGLLEGDERLNSDPQLARWTKMLKEGDQQARNATYEIIRGLADKTLPAAISDPVLAAPFAKSIWHKYLKTADQYNSPGQFSALIGYEYTSQPKGDNLHRVVVFRDGADTLANFMPFSSLMSDDPEKLWAALEKYQQTSNGKALAIPHNSNLSNGRMFALVDFEGAAIDADYARKKARWEPLVEATQIKGDSEAHPFLSPNDEYADYGVAGWEQGNLTMQTAKTNDMLAGDYVREGLKRGLALAQTTGVNPYKFGMIGSTDSHTGLATGDEDNFFGKNKMMEPRADRAALPGKKTEVGTVYGWQYLAGGYAAVWATENTREALFDAMQRKEVYATTGPRISLRFFAGFEFDESMRDLPDLAPVGYQLGVPMGSDLGGSDLEGSDLQQTAGSSAPRFLIRALKDPDGLNLAKAQVIKGWVDSAGELHEQVHDVAQASAESGSAELSAFWQDPDFDAKIAAFYYVRILEIPGYRWPVYDANFYATQAPEPARKKVQERAYSSPIWYNPEQ